MPLITEIYYLSLTQDNRGILRLRCSQDDTLRTVNLKLYNNGSIFVIPSGISASISGVKQNGAVFSKPCTISQNRESVVLQLSSDITNVDGIIVAEIVLNDGEGGRLGTSNFIIQVEKNPIRAGVVQDTETPIEYINDFIEKIQTLTARLNNLITPSGDPSLAEVVDARIGILDSTTYQTLGARLNAEFQKLSNALNGITILESTGDTTDRTSEILSKLNAYGTCKLGKGDFYVNNLVMPEGSQFVGCGNSTRVILPSSVTNGCIVKPRSNCIVENISFYGGFTGTYSELIASGANAKRHCIRLNEFDSVSSENVILNNIYINSFVGSAIIQGSAVGCHCENIVIDMCYAGIDISNASYDGQLVNISMSNTRFGVVQNGSNFVFTNCVSKDSAYHIMSDQQNTGCTFSSCSFSESSLETTSKLASISNAREGFVFDNCLFDSSLSMLLNACDGIVIKGTNFVGSDTFVITVSNGRNTLLLITDCIADVEPTVTNAGTAARITSCYLKDGTAWAISEADITVDDELSDESENPVQNKVVAGAISEIKADLDAVGSALDSVAKMSGAYVSFRMKVAVGGINAAGTPNTTDNKRRKGFNSSCVYLKKGAMITTDGTVCKMKLVRYSSRLVSTSTFVSMSADYLSSYTVEEDGYYTLLFSKDDNTDITDEEHASIEANTYLSIQKTDGQAYIPFATYAKDITNTFVVLTGSSIAVITTVSGDSGFYKIKTANTTVFKWCLCGEDDAFIESSGSTTATSKQTNLSRAERIFIAMQKSNGAAIAVSDLDTFISDLSVVFFPDETERTYGYTGQRVTLGQTFDYRFLGKVAQYGGGSKAIQGMAQYEGKLIVLYDTGYYNVYAISPFSNTALGSGLLASTDTSLHCNACSLGAMHTTGDPFPLLYVTGGKNPVPGYCSVERIKPDYTNEHIQTISIDYTGFAAAGYIEEFVRPNFYVDRGFLYTFSAKYRTDGSEEAHDSENRFVIHKYALPDTSIATVTLTAADVLAEYILPYTTYFMQGGTTHNGKLFELFGCGGATKGSKQALNALRVYNLDGGYEMAQIDLSQVPASSNEIESAAVFGNELLLNYVTGNVYILTF